MGAHLEVYKTKKSNVIDNVLQSIDDELYQELGDIDCSYDNMNNYCKDVNVIELKGRKLFDDSIYHITDDDDINHIKYHIDDFELKYDKESEVIIVVYDNA